MYIKYVRNIKKLKVNILHITFDYFFFPPTEVTAQKKEFQGRTQNLIFRMTMKSTALVPSSLIKEVSGLTTLTGD